MATLLTTRLTAVAVAGLLWASLTLFQDRGFQQLPWGHKVERLLLALSCQLPVGRTQQIQPLVQGALDLSRACFAGQWQPLEDPAVQLPAPTQPVVAVAVLRTETVVAEGTQLQQEVYHTPAVVALEAVMVVILLEPLQPQL